MNWIIPFACLGAIFICRAQELTSFDGQTVTEAPYPNHGVKWDNTRTPVTLKIRDGRTDVVNSAIIENSDQSLIYSNQWEPLLVPIGFNRENESHKSEHEYSVDHQFVPTFLRRPDSELNSTVLSNNYPQPAEINEFSAVPIPLTPIYFYPTQSNLYTNENTQIKQNSSVKPISSHSVASSSEETYKETLPDADFQPRDIQGFLSPITPAPFPTQPKIFSYGNDKKTNLENAQSSSKPQTSGSTTSTTKERHAETSHSENVSFIPQRLQSTQLYRNSQTFVPPMAPVFFPSYPFLPFIRESSSQPVIPYPTYDPIYDREVGSEVVENAKDVPERKAESSDKHDHVAENVSSETSPNTVPPRQLPFPVARFPFGVLPPPFVPPLIPSVPISVPLPLNPLHLPQPSNVQRENIITDPMPPSPIIPASLPLDSAPDVLPQVDYLEPETEKGVLSESQVTPEEIVPNEKLNVPKTPYEFGFDMNDGKGTDQHRKEVSDGSGVVTGSYGYRDVFGIYRIVNYIADKDGFRAFIKSNEPGVASSGSADVVVMAERPPPQATAEGIKVSEPTVVNVADEPTVILSVASNGELE